MTELDHPLHAVVVVPLEGRLEPGVVLVVGVEPKVLAEVHRIVIAEDDLPRVQEPVGVEDGLEIFERFPEVLAVEFAIPLRACAAVTVLARDGAAEFDHEVRHVVGDSLELLESDIGLRVDQRPHVKHAWPGVGVEGRVGVVGLEDRLEPVDELGQPCGRYRRILDEGEVFLVGRPREQDRKTRLAEFPELRSLGLVVRLKSVDRDRFHVARSCSIRIRTARVHLRNAAVGRPGGRDGRATVGEQIGDPLAAFLVVLGVELNEQRRVRSVGEHLGHGSELRGTPGEVDQHVVEHLDGGGVVFENRRDVRHRVAKLRVTQQGDGLRFGNRLEGDGRLGYDRERSFAAGEHPREVDETRFAGVFSPREWISPGFRDQPIEVVPRDVSLEVGVRLGNRVRVLLQDPPDFGVNPLLERAVSIAPVVDLLESDLAESGDGSVREDDFAGLDISVGLAVLQGVCTCRIVPDRAADRTLVAPCRVRRELEIVGLYGLVERPQDRSRLDRRGPAVGIGRFDLVHVPGQIEDDGAVYRLSGETRPAAAGQDWNAPSRTVLDDASDVGRRFGEDDADWRHLVGTGVGGVQLSRVRVEANRTVDEVLEVPNQTRPVDIGARVVVSRACVGGRIVTRLRGHTTF